MTDILKDLLFFSREGLREVTLLVPALAAILGVGARVLRVSKLYNPATPTGILFAFGLGMGIMAHIILGLGGIGLWYPMTGWILSGTGCFIGCWEVKSHWNDYQKWLGKFVKRRHFAWFGWLFGGLFCLNLIYPLLADALVPPFEWDEVAYHLAIPKIYLQRHQIVYLPSILQSNWPLELEMLFAWGLFFGTDIFAHLISWSVLIATCVGVGILGRRYFGWQTGLLAAVILSATPLVWRLGGTALVEPTLMLYVLLALWGFLDWTEDHQPSSLILSAIFGGLVASTKFNGVVIPATLGVFVWVAWVMRHWKTGWRNALLGGLREFLVYGSCALVVVFPWYLKAWVQTGNPVWPLFMELFATRNWDALGSEYFFQYVQTINMPGNIFYWAIGLWELTLHPTKYGAYQYTLGWSYAVLLPLSGPALFGAASPARRALRWLAAFGVVAYTLWFLGTHQTRFLMPVLPIWALLASAGVKWLWNLVSGASWKTVVQISVFILVCLSAWFVQKHNLSLMRERWRYLSGQQDRTAFLTTIVPGYQAFVYVNEHLPEDAYVLLALWEVRGYYLDRDYFWANPIAQRAIQFEQFPDAASLAAFLREQGFSHILFNRGQLETFSFIRYGPQITETFEGMLGQYAQRLVTYGEMEVYELLPELK